MLNLISDLINFCIPVLKNADMERHLPGIAWPFCGLHELFFNYYFGFGFKSFYIQIEVTFKQQRQIQKPQWFLILLKKINKIFGIYFSFALN